ncbi:type II CRISPR RNA-guided endonuclease Cas9 [Sulfurimonas sp.]|uniref:type II CRISPR RNA-guided endonuclease Cas9 n=1 Tax=Sulfurimonas sp. TaxID=2022749 RepID=UPI0025E9DA8D|nr:type II CRISPR RNA-guided endonuclease Cas9 [Sulfurimonas sp.]MBW6487535.1 type II CRISPR RNA-guided endonuclease Cas9 [Sulfurimonas sp.]
MTERILGLDITKKRIGWALIEHNPKDTSENLIVDCGGFDFNAGEIPKTGESPNKPRRDARLARRTIKKKRKRKAAMRSLFVEYDLLNKDIDFEVFISQNISPWHLRAKALGELLDGEELARILYHIGGKRGYQFTRAEEIDMHDGESGKIKEAGRALVSAIEESSSKTVGEYLAKLDRKRNTHIAVVDKKGKTSKEATYDRSTPRWLLKQEIDVIFTTQQSLGSKITTNELKKEFKDLAFFMPDPQSTERLLGKCTFFPNETRAVKASLDAEEFVALTRFINCVLEMSGTGIEKKITELMPLDELMTMAKEKASISHSDIRKRLSLGDEWIFKGVKYDTKTKKASKKAAIAKTGLFNEEPEDEIVLDYKYEKKALVEMKAYHTLKNALMDDFKAIEGVYNDVAFVLTVERGENSIKTRLQKLGLKESIIEKLIEKADPKIFKETINLSHKALDVVLPKMREGMRYDQSVLELGVTTFDKSHFLPALINTNIEVNNPIVLRVVAKLRTIVNEVIRFHGSFHKVHIELGSDMNTNAEKKMIDAAQREREAQKNIAKTKIKELFGEKINHENRRNIEKMMLFTQQNEMDLYTGKKFEIERLYEDGYAAVDYILPRSRSFDETFGNKVLTFAEQKIDKEDKTPFEWLGDNSDKWESFKSLVSSPMFFAKLGRGKVNRLLKENFNDQSAADAASKRLEKSRQYAARVIKQLFEDYLDMPKSPLGGKIQVFTRNAWLTAELRRQWIGFETYQEHADRISVLNAILVAFSTEHMIKNLTQHFKWKETKWTKEWLQSKRDKGEEAVSWEKEKKRFDKPYPEFKTDAIKLLQYDRSEYDRNGVLRKRLLIAKTPRKSTTGPAHDAGVSSIKGFGENAKGVVVRDGTALAAHKSIFRLDVFKNGKKNAFIPIYIADTKKPLSDVALIDSRGNTDVVSGEEFKFTLYRNDLIGIMQKGNMRIGYYTSFNRATLALDIIADTPLTIGGGTAEIVKYTVDPLGFYYPVKSEPRMPTLKQKRK